MAVANWVSLVVRAIGGAALVAAAQLGVASLLGLLVFTQPGVNSAGLARMTTWIVFIFAVSVLAGAGMARARVRGLRGLIANRRALAAITRSRHRSLIEAIRRRAVDAVRGTAAMLTRVVAAVCAGAGAAAAFALIWFPLRNSSLDAGFGQAGLAKAAAIGVAAGVVLALAALYALPVGAGAFTTTLWVWSVGVASVLRGAAGGGDRMPPRLAVLESPSGGERWWLGANLMVAIALVLGVAVAAIARWAGGGRLGLALSGFAGPGMVAVAYLAAGTAADSDLTSAYIASLLAATAGLLGSTATGLARLGPAREAGPGAGTAPTAPAKAPAALTATASTKEMAALTATASTKSPAALPASPARAIEPPPAPVVRALPAAPDTALTRAAKSAEPKPAPGRRRASVTPITLEGEYVASEPIPATEARAPEASRRAEPVQYSTSASPAAAASASTPAQRPAPGGSSAVLFSDYPYPGGKPAAKAPSAAPKPPAARAAAQDPPATRAAKPTSSVVTNPAPLSQPVTTGRPPAPARTVADPPRPRQRARGTARVPAKAETPPAETPPAETPAAGAPPAQRSGPDRSGKERSGSDRSSSDRSGKAVVGASARGSASNATPLAEDRNEGRPKKLSRRQARRERHEHDHVAWVKNLVNMPDDPSLLRRRS